MGIIGLVAGRRVVSYAACSSVVNSHSHSVCNQAQQSSAVQFDLNFLSSVSYVLKFQEFLCNCNWFFLKGGSVTDTVYLSNISLTLVKFLALPGVYMSEFICCDLC